MKKNILLLYLLYMISASPLFADDWNLHFNLNGKSYDSLLFVGFDAFGGKTIIAGVEQGGGNWMFTIPDSVGQLIRGYRIQPALYNEKTKTYREIGFVFNDKMDVEAQPVSWLYLDDKNLVINADFREINTDSVTKIGSYMQTDYFTVSFCSNMSYFLLSQNCPNFILSYLEEDEYRKTVNEFSDTVRAHPDSRFLITLLHMRYPSFRAKKDLEQVFSQFSDNAKNTYFGKTVERYLSTDYYFENMSLPLWDESAEEQIVKKPEKYNLVMFSASWCMPCHRQIPKLKEIYNDLKDSLEMTYISIDDDRTVKEWKELMQKEAIPWRSLMAVNSLKEIKEKYFISGVPIHLLIHPDGYIERLDINEEKQKNELYEKVQK